MCRIRIWLTLILVLAAATAQGDNATWIAAGVADWNDDANWQLGDGSNAFPDASFADAPVITNGGIAYLDQDALGNADPFPSVTVGGAQGGGIEVRNGGGFSTVALTVEANASLSLAGASSVAVTGDAALNGTTRIIGGQTSFSVGGNLDLSGRFEAVLDRATHGAIGVGGVATLGGTLVPSFDGIAPKLGDSWPLIDAASLSGAFSAIDVTQAPTLADGVIYTTAVDSGAGNVNLVVTNTLDLVVNRRTGETSLRNVVGNPISFDSYVIESPSGRLNSGGWTGQAGWTPGSNSGSMISESTSGANASIVVGSPLSLGTAVTTANFAVEDLQLTYEVDGVSLPGIVTFEGIPFNLVLNVDPATGSAEIVNRATVPIEFDGYAIWSPSGALKPANGSWSSLADSGAGGGGWQEANPTSTALAELNPAGTTSLAPNASLSIGPLFDPAGAQDLSFSFFLAGGTPDLRAGFVGYGLADVPPVVTLQGDIDGDGSVAFADFLILSASFGQTVTSGTSGDIDGNGEVGFSDFLILSANFGRSAAAVVPEPNGLGLLLCGALLMGLGRRRRN